MPGIKRKQLNRKRLIFLTMFAFFAVCGGAVRAQIAPSAPRATRSPLPPAARRINDSGIPAEKALAVDERANVQFCVEQGNVKVSGWDRAEVRAMIEAGSFVGFKVLNKSAENIPANVRIIGYDPQKSAPIGIRDCLRGENIEIDVPRGATVRIEGGRVAAAISSVYKADIRNDGGDIVLNDIAEGIRARTYQGDLRVENSGGAITLQTTNGSIFAYNAKPIEFGDIFSARTNGGAINLQAIEYPQITTKTTSGAINFSGSILSGGQYSFDTQNGAIQLNVPPKSSFAVTATYAYGKFQTEIPMTNVTRTPGQPQRLTGQTGSGDATLTISTYVGSISIKTKQ